MKQLEARSVSLALLVGLGALSAGSGCGGDDSSGGGGSGNVGGSGGTAATGGTGGAGGTGGTAATGGAAGSGGTGALGGAAGTGGAAGSGGSGGSGPGTQLKVTECKTVTASGTGLCSTAAGTGQGRAAGRHGAGAARGPARRRGPDRRARASSPAWAATAARGRRRTAATVTCANGVISPGLINSHDHITYANNQPAPTAARALRPSPRVALGDGPTASRRSRTTAAPRDGGVLAAELRFVMSGATSTISAGGAERTCCATSTRRTRKGCRRRPSTATRSRSTTPAASCTTAAATTALRRHPGRRHRRLDGYQPHIAEGVNQAARNELTCTAPAGTTDIIEPKTGIVHAVASTRDGGRGRSRRRTPGSSGHRART